MQSQSCNPMGIGTGPFSSFIGLGRLVPPSARVKMVVGVFMPEAFRSQSEPCHS